jgi:unsaturated chondroitin disaccharide hydrolase
MRKVFEIKEEITQVEVEKALDFSCKQILKCLPEFTHKFQNAYSENNYYKPIDNVDWTNGFWTGEIWLAYEFCGSEKLLEANQLIIYIYSDAAVMPFAQSWEGYIITL